MKLGILQCDEVSPRFIANHGYYPAMYVNLFKDIDPNIQHITFDVEHGLFPDHVDAADAYLITGSHHGVNDGYTWIIQLEEFVRCLDKAGKKVIGICFGHQSIAKAMGGRVIKSPKGWGVGMSQNQLLVHKPWMHERPSSFNILVSHQDQVVTLPPNAEVLASSEFCPNYMLQIGNNLLTIQGHPEYSKAFIHDLIKSREDRLSDEESENGLVSLNLPEDDQIIAQWIINFLKMK